MEEITLAIAALVEAIEASDIPELTFSVDDYRVVVSQGGELISVTRR